MTDCHLNERKTVQSACLSQQQQVPILLWDALQCIMVTMCIMRNAKPDLGKSPKKTKHRVRSLPETRMTILYTVKPTSDKFCNLLVHIQKPLFSLAAEIRPSEPFTSHMIRRIKNM